MRAELLTLDCSRVNVFTLRKKPFRIVRYTLDYSDARDRALIDTLVANAEEMSTRVFAGKANDSVAARSIVTVRANCYAGVISEYFWKIFLNGDNGNYVRETNFVSASNQIDLEVIKGNRKIEVRSSFPRNGSNFAICNPKYQFDILGPYHNAYKPNEVSKDFFVRTFFTLKFPSEILMAVKSNEFIIDLVGGATWDMMWNPSLSKEKKLTPGGTDDVEVATSYRVVPMAYALDSIEIRNLIRQN